MSEPDNNLRERLYAALGKVIDPEIGLDIVTLGMVYGVAIQGGAVEVIFSLTTPGCPMEHAIRSGISHAVSQVEGVEEIKLSLVWEPRWHPGMVVEGAL